jgi:hypothetical protein
MLEHLLVFSWNGIDVFFLIKKLHLCHSRRTPGDVLAFLYTLMWIFHIGFFFSSSTLSLSNRRQSSGWRDLEGLRDQDDGLGHSIRFGRFELWTTRFSGRIQVWIGTLGLISQTHANVRGFWLDLSQA